MTSLQGRVALVTGGSRGIGAAIAKRLAADGADVAITYVSSPDKANAVVAEIEKLGRRGLAIQADSADSAAVIAAVEKTAAHFKRLDILVNNAGIFLAGPFEDASPEDLDRLWNVNVRAPIVGIQAAVKHMQKGGRIITVGSCLGERVAGPGVTLYSMTKAAVVGLTRGLARDLGAKGICVNVVEPGPIDTDMNPADGEGADNQRAATALGRYGQADDIAAMVSHLAGESGRYSTGAAFLVDGGYAA
ncbi:MAG TPA: 3-oxoacyl-ACP reductase family protein [Lacipirellulaceae bacterium]|jgi:NAD(P)-dependent dehydrogenase (short-subunit alcohol dehydrogenase family)|nr:3-oxoacyl-ACP reductase family protein [Lacipirellulaceae bacterium]